MLLGVCLHPTHASVNMQLQWFILLVLIVVCLCVALVKGYVTPIVHTDPRTLEDAYTTLYDAVNSLVKVATPPVK